MAELLQYGAPEYFQELDRQVQAAIAPGVIEGEIKPEQANEMRAKAQRRGRKQVDRFYGLNNKYDGAGRLRAA